MKVTVLLAIFWIAVASATPIPGQEPVVKFAKEQITYQGTTKGAIEHFQNIRFAYDTSGEGRFAPPVPYTPPTGSIIDATTPGAACPQSRAAIAPFFDETPEISEDCLTLRISRPFGTKADDKLPVVVWLHGGAVIKGSAYDSHFEPDKLLTLSTSIGKPVIYVSINYRITIFGFARLQVLKDQQSLNVGMRDQRAGFQWVKDNIVAFGGDPTRVTSYGLSAGGTFTTLHLMTYGGEKGVPFTQMWAMSGPPGTALNITSDATEIHTRAVAEKVDCGDKDGVEQLSCLRDVSMEKLTEVAMEYSLAQHPPVGGFTFIPSVDGDLLPERQSVLYKSGRFVKGIPAVLGWTQDDGATNAGPAPMFQTEEDMKTPIRGFTHALDDEDFAQLFALYPASDFEEESQNYKARRAETEPVAPVNYFRISRIMRDLLFTCSSIDFGNELSSQSRAIDPAFSGIRLYDLNQSMLTPMFKAIGMPYVQTCHGSDTHYIFNGLFPEGEVSESDQKLSTSLSKSFINFAYTGNPTYADDEHFKSWPESFPESHGKGYSRCAKGKHQSPDGDLENYMQQPLGDRFEYGEMKSARDQERARLLENEKLLERCAFIGGLAEKLAV
ncbi:hypothetical protein LQW54_001972 [Pestalotiopsis sp. IQ-011]